MDTKRGVFIAIEGTDGSGKGTQFGLLRQRLEAGGYEVAAFDFPQYEHPSSHFVREYLNGQYGGNDQVGPYTASLFYALDRFSAAQQIREALNAGKVVISNRFTGSSMAHQGTKIARAEERRGFFIWLDNLEFELLRIPRPDLSFVLRVPAEVANELIERKPSSGAGKRARDIHEADFEHLRRSVTVYDDLCQLFPKDFLRIDCVREGKLLPVEMVEQLIWQRTLPLLPDPKPMVIARTAQAIVPTTNSATRVTDLRPAAVNDDAQPTLDASHQQLQASVSSTWASVYGLTDSLDAAQVARIMDHSLKTGQDVRSTIISELSGKTDPTQVTSQIPHYYVFEGGSDLLSRHLALAEATGSAEPSATYMHYDKKDRKGNYKYYVPAYLPSETAVQYHALMNSIFSQYTDMLVKLTAYLAGDQQDGPPIPADEARVRACELLRGVLPVAAKSTVGMYLTDTAVRQLALTLSAHELPELRQAGSQLIVQLRLLRPELAQALETPEAQATITSLGQRRAQLASLANQHLPANHADQSTPVRLTAVSPRNEIDLLPTVLYESSGLPISDLQSAVQAWPYNQKLEVFEAYSAQLAVNLTSGAVTNTASYEWDIVADYGTFAELQRAGLLHRAQAQTLTPRHGYDIPPTVEAAGLLDQYEACFDSSFRLYSLLQQGYPHEAQYATLQGHRLRWTAKHSLTDIKAIGQLSQQSPQIATLARELYARVAEVHPILAETLGQAFSAPR